MLSLTLLTLFTTTLATPFPKPETTTSNQAVAACLLAPNCETYERKHGGTGIRFKTGYEPGSEKHKRLMARAAEPVSTKIQVSDNQIAWGCGVDPVVELGNLGESCHDSGCVPDDAYERTVQHLDVINNGDSGFSGTEETKLSIHAEGRYSNTDQRDSLISIIQATAGGKDPNDDANTLIQLHKDVTWSRQSKHKRSPESPAVAGGRGGSPGDENVDPNSQDDKNGFCDVPVLSSFIQATMWDGEHPPNLVANIDATAELPDLGPPISGFCLLKDNFDFASMVLGPIGEVGGKAAEGFGALSALCE